MNIEEFDLEHLIILWQSSDGNPLIKQQIEIELKKRINNNSKFSREYFFEICKVKNHAITVSFIPTSEAYENYGSSLTIDILLDDDEMRELLTNYSAKPPMQTQGIIKAKVLVKDNFTKEQITKAESIGFHTII